MADDDTENASPSSSHPYFVRAEFPFVFTPAPVFTFADVQTQVSTSESTDQQEDNEEENTEEILQPKENVKRTEDKNDLRISQSKYAQLLKDLDFSHTKMVDVTDLLSDEGDQPGNYLTPDENENQKKISGDEKYQSMPSSRSSISSDRAIGHQSSSSFDNTRATDENKTKENENFINATNDTQNDLNHLGDIIQEVSQKSTEQDVIVDKQKKHQLDEDDDTSKQATQNYDLNDNEQEDTGHQSKSTKIPDYTTQYSSSTHYDNLSSIPRLNTNTNKQNETQEEEHPMTWDNLINGTDGFNQDPTILIFSIPFNEPQSTPIKQQQQQQQRLPSSKEKSKQKAYHRSRQISPSSDTDSIADYTLHRSKQKQQTSKEEYLIDEDLSDLNNHLEQVLLDREQQTTKDRLYSTPSDILFRRLANQPSPNRKKTHHRQSTVRHENNIPSPNTDTWLIMLEKLEREHKERLEKQQKQYEDYMRDLEEKMKQRCNEYLLTTTSLQESKSEKLDDSKTHDSTDRRYSHTHPYRPLAKDTINHHHYPSNHSVTSDKRPPIGTNLLRSQSREDITNLRTELSSKHNKHISDLKSYYEHELDQLKSQLKRSKMGHTTSTTQQSIETIERINSENIRLHDEVKGLRQTLKTNKEETHSLKRQLDEVREQLNKKDLEVKTCQRTVNELEEQLNETHNIKDRQDEKLRHADKQALFNREENEKLKSDLNRTRERLARLEERNQEQENANKSIRQTLFTTENNHNRVPDDLNLNSTMSLNMPTSREYGKFTLSSSKYSTSTLSTPRDGNLDSGRYPANDSDDLFRHNNSSRPLTRLNDYINEKPTFPQPYIPPPRPLYSPRRTSPNQHRIDHMPVRDLIDNQIKQSEQLEEKFDDLLRKKRDLESRINRIPTRNLTSNDRQLLDVLEPEIERVEQQISSVKLELRKMNILRTH